MDPNDVIIVGAGMAGLCAGIYLQMNGFRVRILEAHHQPGGLCTGWERGGYTFDGCIHWLLGSGPGTPMHGVWKELVDLDAMDFVDHEQVFALEVGVPDARGDTWFHLYADLDRQERYLREAAPEDGAAIRQWMRAARRFVRQDLPPLQPPRELRTWRDTLAMAPLLPVLPALRRWSRTTGRQFAARCRTPFLKRSFELLFGEHEAAMVVLFFQQAWYHQRCAGYPVGGSLFFVRRFEARFRELGGEVRYGARVREILLENGAAVGVRLEDGTEERAGVVVSAADGRWTLFEALGGRYLTPQLEDLYAERVMPLFPSLVYVSLGVRDRLESLPAHVSRFLLDAPWVLPDGSTVRQVSVHAYRYDPTLAPEGGTAVTVMLESRGIEFWQDLRERDRDAYRAAKQAVADRIIDLLDARHGGVRAAVEVVDVATPATFHRYTGNWKGSYEGWFPVGDFLSLPPIPRRLPGLAGFHMVGQWVEPGGGLPPAALHGRDLAQVLCREAGRPFRVVPPG